MTVVFQARLIQNILRSHHYQILDGQLKVQRLSPTQYALMIIMALISLFQSVQMFMLLIMER